jgi:hypothetical protein
MWSAQVGLECPTGHILCKLGRNPTVAVKHRAVKHYLLVKEIGDREM